MKSAPNTWNTRNRSKQRMMYHSSTFGSSTTSFDDSPIFSPSASSTWSRSLGKPPSGMSSDSLTSAFSHVDYGFAPSAGFASALSNAIIREEEGPAEEDPDNLPYLEDESLGLEGAPWAKEGMVKHKHDLEAAGKRSSNRNWQEAFAVIEKGRMRLFSFSTKSQKKRSAREGGGVVGGGNWMDNAEELDSFVLRQTLSRELPRPGYSKQRPHVFNLMLPNGGLHLFQVGTPEIAKEFASTANYWSARLSKEPLVGGVSNIEYGWSENILNTALLESRSDSASGSMRPPSSARIHSPTPSSSAISSRPSFQGSLRGASIDLSGRHAVRTPADKITLGTWTPPQQILKPSNMREEQQLEALKRYQQGVWEETNRHLEFRGPMELAVSTTYIPYYRRESHANANPLDSSPAEGRTMLKLCTIGSARPSFCKRNIRNSASILMRSRQRLRRDGKCMRIERSGSDRSSLRIDWLGKAFVHMIHVGAGRSYDFMMRDVPVGLAVSMINHTDPV